MLKKDNGDKDRFNRRRLAVLSILFILTMILGNLLSFNPVTLTQGKIPKDTSLTSTYGTRKSSLDAPGAIQWQQIYGGPKDEEACAMIQTVDGGFVLVGAMRDWVCTGETEECITIISDIWMVKTDANGVAQWNRTYGGSANEKANAMIQTVDGGFVIAGFTESYGAGESDFWLVKTDAHGVALWNRTYGSWGLDEASSVIQTADGGFAIAGFTGSYGAGDEWDAWLVKTDAHGVALWNRTYGGSSLDCAYSLIETADGGFALTGYTRSYGVGKHDMWLVKSDGHGVALWNRTYGGSANDVAYAMIQTVDGGFAFAGYTDSYGARGDFWLVKTDGSGVPQWNQTYGGPMGEEAYAMIQTADGGFALAGLTWSYGAGDTDMWLVRTDAYGVALWNRTYGGWGWDEASSIIQTADGGFALAGRGVSEASFSDFWLVKIAPSNKAPTVLVIRPNGGERVHGTYEIQWEANDPDGDALTFTVYYSPNGGQTWTQFMGEMMETSYQWDTSGVEVGANYLIKVEASDGTLMAEDSSDAPFTIERETIQEMSLKIADISSFGMVAVLGAILVLISFKNWQRRRSL